MNTSNFFVFPFGEEKKGVFKTDLNLNEFTVLIGHTCIPLHCRCYLILLLLASGY